MGITYVCSPQCPVHHQIPPTTSNTIRQHTVNKTTIPSKLYIIDWLTRKTRILLWIRIIAQIAFMTFSVTKENLKYRYNLHSWTPSKLVPSKFVICVSPALALRKRLLRTSSLIYSTIIKLKTRKAIFGFLSDYLLQVVFILLLVK